MDQELSFKGCNPGAVRYGNYINYYSFHPPEARIECLESVPSKIWQVEANYKKIIVVLDIGCNCGNLTKELHSFYTKMYNDYKIVCLGIDIDPKLIDRANDLHKDENISFQCMNIMEPSSIDVLWKFLSSHGKRKFDIVTCFSTTMWIHLNNGDDGLIKFLELLSSLSYLLIVEPQPWSRYREAVRRLKKESETFPLYNTLKIRSNVVSEIENIILKCRCVIKLYETTSLVWTRKVLFFRNIV